MKDEDSTLDGDFREPHDEVLEEAYKAFKKKMKEGGIYIGKDVELILYPQGERGSGLGGYKNCPIYRGALLGFHKPFVFLRINNKNVPIPLRRYRKITLIDSSRKKKESI